MFEYNNDCVSVSEAQESVLTAVLAQGSGSEAVTKLPLSDFLSGESKAISSESGAYFPISADGWNAVISAEGQEMSAFINLSGQV